MDHDGVARVLEALEELEQMCELLTSGPENYLPQRASERLNEAINQVDAFLQQQDVVNLLDPLISKAYQGLMTSSANTLADILRKPASQIRREEPVIADTIREKDVIDAIDAFQRLRHKVSTFGSNIVGIRSDFEDTVQKVISEIAETAGSKGRGEKHRRRSKALRAIRIGVIGIGLLIANGLNPALYADCYAMGAGSMRLARRFLFEDC